MKNKGSGNVTGLKFENRTRSPIWRSLVSDKLQRLQNRPVIVLTHTSYNADANQLLNWENLETRRQKLKAEMVYKSLNGLALNHLSSKFIQRSDVITSHNLCDSDDKFAIPSPRTITKIALAIVGQFSGTVYPQLLIN